jgi:hypothetical protein
MADDTRKDWEVVQEDVGKSVTERLHFLGGWLVRTIVESTTGPSAVSMVFIPKRDTA